MRRRTNAFSFVIGTRFDRSTQSHDRTVHVWRSQSAYIDRSQQGVSARQRPLFVNRYAHDRRRVFSHLSNQASAAAEVGDSSLARFSLTRRRLLNHDAAEQDKEKQYEKLHSANRIGSMLRHICAAGIDG